MSAELSNAQLVAQPIAFHRSKLVAPNRILKSAMTERLCSWGENGALTNGKPTPEYLKLYEEWGAGAIGTIVLGNIPVDVRYPEAQKNATIDRDAPWDHVAAFTPIVAAAKAHGSVCIAQLTHAGRQTSTVCTDQPVSSSNIQAPPMGGMTFDVPRPMTIAEIEDLADRFAFAADILYKSGCDGIQLHAAHGYLLSQFLSPRVNKRTDKYGGSFENRSRIIFEIIAAVRARVPDEKFMLSIKINSADFSDGGFSAEESKELIIKLEDHLDLIELSGGTYESRAFEHKKESTIAREAFFIEFAANIRPHLKFAKLCVTGGFRSIGAMGEALREKSTDMVGLARPLTAEPAFGTALVAGTTLKAKANEVPSALQTGSSVMQIHDIATGAALRDLSDAAVAAATAQTLMAGK